MQEDVAKEKIKTAAQELFRKFGYHKTSVNEIAKKAAIAKATIYNYFDSKELILYAILMDYLHTGISDLTRKFHPQLDRAEKLSALILKTSRLSYTVCNEFIGWDFIRQSTNAQDFLKNLSNDLEQLLVNTFLELKEFSSGHEDQIKFLVKASKSVVFSFAFTSVSVADVRKNFVVFEKEILPYLVKAALI